MSEELLVIGVCGRARAGKDTVARILADADFLRIGLADGVKSALNDLDGATWDFRKERDAAGLTDRWAAQTLGTECREEVASLHLWVDLLLAKLRYAAKHHPVPRGRFVIPDIRFPFEAYAIGCHV